jgi:hypothetical protein
MSSPSEIFLSHASADAVAADRVSAVLKLHGLPVWYAPTNIVGAQQWQDEIGAALKRCDWFVILLSPASVESMWVKRELQYALRDARYDGRITPIVIEPCEVDNLSWVLPSIQMIDCATDLDSGFKELLRVWGIGYNAVA